MNCREFPECDCWLSAHSAPGKMAGLAPDQLRPSRQATVADGKTDALLHFRRQMVETQGQ